MIKSMEKDLLKKAQWRTYTDTLQICQRLAEKAEKWEGFLIKSWDLRSKNYWYCWEKLTPMPAPPCSHPLTRKSWTISLVLMQIAWQRSKICPQKFKMNLKHSSFLLLCNECVLYILYAKTNHKNACTVYVHGSKIYWEPREGGASGTRILKDRDFTWLVEVYERIGPEICYLRW